MSENRKELEERLAREYLEYCDQCAKDKVEAIKFVNWVVNKKVAEAKDEEAG